MADINKKEKNINISKQKKNAKVENTKKDKTKKEKKVKEGKKIKKKIDKKTLRIIIASLVAIVLLVIVSFGIYKGVIYFSNREYRDYEKKMAKYGLDQLYNNSSPKSSESVTTSETIAIMVAATLKTNDLSSFITIFEPEEYNNKIFVEYARSMGILELDQVTVENQGNILKYINTIELLYKTRNILLIDSYVAPIQMNFKNLSVLTAEQKEALNFLVASNIVENNKKNINFNKKMTKGMLNKLIVEYVEKLNLIAFSGSELETDKTKLPSNSDEYSYIVKGVDKSVYETPIYNFEDTRKENSAKVYTHQKQRYDIIKDMSENYLNALINIDYNTIDVETFKNAINKDLYDLVPDSQINEYVDFVKTNKVKISGEAKFQEPIIYYDGMRFRARFILKFNVESADTLKNLLFTDSDYTEEVSYNLGQTELMIDLPLKRVYQVFNVVGRSIYYSISNNIKDIYTYIEETET